MLYVFGTPVIRFTDDEDTLINFRISVFHLGTNSPKGNLSLLPLKQKITHIKVKIFYSLSLPTTTTNL